MEACLSLHASYRHPNISIRHANPAVPFILDTGDVSIEDVDVHFNKSFLSIIFGGNETLWVKLPQAEADAYELYNETHTLVVDKIDRNNGYFYTEQPDPDVLIIRHLEPNVP